MSKVGWAIFAVLFAVSSLGILWFSIRDGWNPEGLMWYVVSIIMTVWCLYRIGRAPRVPRED